MKLTREGKRFLLATALLTFAAYNTGNNLIYLILALMFSIISISVVALILNMKGLSISVSTNGPVFAGQEAMLEVTVRNRKRVLPSYSLRVIMPSGIEGGGIVASVASSSEASAECITTFKKRGIYRWGDFELESGFPYIFLTRRIKVPIDGTVIVYPKLVEVEEHDTVSGEGQSAYTIKPGQGEELLTIREYRDGDEIKYISWKATAKSRRLMVRELAEEKPSAINIILDDLTPHDAETCEKAVSYAASIALKLLDEGYYVGLVTSAKRLPFGSGPEHLYRILDVVAVARETEEAVALYEDDASGINYLVLKSANSSMRGLDADMVIYAS